MEEAWNRSELAGTLNHLYQPTRMQWRNATHFDASDSEYFAGCDIWYLLRKHSSYKGCDRLQLHTGMGCIPAQKDGRDKLLLWMRRTLVIFYLTHCLINTSSAVNPATSSSFLLSSSSATWNTAAESSTLLAAGNRPTQCGMYNCYVV